MFVKLPVAIFVRSMFTHGALEEERSDWQAADGTRNVGFAC
jgi:hypothetical protein